MSGTVTICGQQQFDKNTGKLLVGGLLYFFQSGTLIAQNGFRDPGLTLVYPNPLTLDTTGRVPNIYFADGTIRLRLSDKNGIQQFDNDNTMVLGSSSGGGSVPVNPTDPNALFSTGDLKPRYGVGILPGFVRGNGNSISDTGKGGTERANPDCQALYQYLWNTDPNLAVFGGRGGSALSDWQAANKPISLPDFRGVMIGFLDDMGAAAAGRLTVANFATLGPTVLGALGGKDTLVGGVPQASLPAITPAVTIPSLVSGVPQWTHSHGKTISNGTAFWTAGGSGTNQSPVAGGGMNSNGDFTIGNAIMPTLVGNLTAALGSAANLPILSPTRLVTCYIRL